MRQLCVLVLVSVLAGCVVGVAGASAAAAEKRAGPEADALVLGRAASPALKALRSAAELDTTRAAEVDRLRPQRYDMLVVDGHHLTGDELRRRASLQNFVAAGKWIAAFDVLPSDHEALRTYTGFDVADAEHGDRSELFVFRVARIDGTPTVHMINSGPYTQRGTAQLGDRRQDELNQEHVRRVARLGRATRAKVQTLACEPLRPAPDPELQHVSFCYVDAGLKPAPYGYWTRDKYQWWMDSFGPPSQQTSTWTMNHRFDVFLENDPVHPAGNFQTVSYALNGQFAPATGQKFARMTDYFTTGWDNCTCTVHFVPERAWWTGQIEPKVTPSPSTSSKLVWQGSHPDSTNAQTNYSSGEEFSVGFTASGTAGSPQNVVNVSDGFNLNWTSSQSQSYTIDDWGVENKGFGTELHWLFSARQPCDTRVAASNPSACFVGTDAEASGTHPAMPRALSKGQMQVNASGRWRTRQHLGASDGSLTFNLATPVQLIDTYCEAQFANWCWSSRPAMAKYATAASGPSPDDVTLDASWVNVIPIKELKLSPNPANGEKNEKVTGTVVLERPAAIPVTVKLFSNSGNAVFPSPLPGVNGGSQSRVTIDQGKSSGTFTLATNDNKLSSGAHTTANITAAYAEATSEQLRVVRPPAG